MDLGGVEPPARSTQNAQAGTFPQALKNRIHRNIVSVFINLGYALHI